MHVICLFRIHYHYMINCHFVKIIPYKYIKQGIYMSRKKSSLLPRIREEVPNSFLPPELFSILCPHIFAPNLFSVLLLPLLYILHIHKKDQVMEIIVNIIYTNKCSRTFTQMQYSYLHNSYIRTKLASSLMIADNSSCIVSCRD